MAVETNKAPIEVQLVSTEVSEAPMTVQMEKSEVGVAPLHRVMAVDFFSYFA